MASGIASESGSASVLTLCFLSAAESEKWQFSVAHVKLKEKHPTSASRRYLLVIIGYCDHGR